MRKLMEIKLYSRNLIKGMNTWALLLLRYSGSFLNWAWEEVNKWPENKKTNDDA